MKPAKSLSYCGQEVYAHDRDRFLLSLFAPPKEREALLALYALNLELARIPQLVREEMIGHIRYAWWKDAVEGLYAGTAPRGHPVLDTLVSWIDTVPAAVLLSLIERYSAAYPESPPDMDALLGEISCKLVQILAPQAEKKITKAEAILAQHRKRYGNRRRSWLSFKLLIAGR